MFHPVKLWKKTCLRFQALSWKFSNCLCIYIARSSQLLSHSSGILLSINLSLNIVITFICLWCLQKNDICAFWLIYKSILLNVKGDSPWPGIRNVVESLHGSKHFDLTKSDEGMKKRQTDTWIQERCGWAYWALRWKGHNSHGSSMCLLYRGRVITCRQARRQSLFYTAGSRRQALWISVGAICRGVVFRP